MIVTRIYGEHFIFVGFYKRRKGFEQFFAAENLARLGKIGFGGCSVFVKEQPNGIIARFRFYREFVRVCTEIFCGE